MASQSLVPVPLPFLCPPARSSWRRGGGSAEESRASFSVSRSPRLRAFPRVLPPTSPTHHPREGAGRRQKRPPPSLHPLPGTCSSLTLRGCSWPDFPGRCEPRVSVPRRPSLSRRAIELARQRRVSGKARPGWGKPPRGGRIGHLLEAEVSLHFEMSLQVPRKEEENSCCCHHQLFPQIARPPAPCVHLAEESRGRPGRWQVGEARESQQQHSSMPGVCWGRGRGVSCPVPAPCPPPRQLPA